MTDTTQMETEPASRSRGRYFAVAGIAIVVVALIYVFGSRFGEDISLVESPLIGQPVVSMDLEYLDRAGSVNFSNYEGEVLVVNFWASWCVPCRSEHTQLTTTAAAYESSGVQFLGVVFQDDGEAAMGFLDQLGWGGGNYEYVTDPDSRAAVEFGVYGVPETFVIDATGTIVHKFTGPVTAGALDSVLSDVLQ